MDDTDFEEFCFELLGEIGFVNVDWRKGTPRPSDRGRDIQAQLQRTDIDGSRHKVEAATESSAAANPHVDIDTAISYIRNFAASWTKAKPLTRAILIQSIYAQIIVRGDEFVSVRLTPDAYAHGLALALPEEVAVPALPTWGGARWCGSSMVLARPTGVGRAIATYVVLIEDRDEWLAAARRLA